MLIATSSNIYQVGVSFDADSKQFSFSGPDVVHDGTGNGVSIPVAPGIQIINFTLLTTPLTGPQATFQFYPIQWIGTPELSPAMGLGQWFDSTSCRLVVFNTRSSGGTGPVGQDRHGFIFTVMHEGAAYTSPDPTIINDPPVGG
jgi:hypothetical protein